MKLITITATYGVTINLGNYESAKVAMTLGAEIEENEDTEAANKQLFDMAREMVIARAKPLIERRDARIEGITANLPPKFRGGGMNYK